MNVYLTLSYWLYLPQFWVIFGILFVLFELADGSAIFLLPMGAGSFLMAALQGDFDLKAPEQRRVASPRNRLVESANRGADAIVIE